MKDLFFNVPVRRKFLKSPSLDENEITKSVLIEALAHPEIKFQLISNRRPQLLFQAASLSDRIKAALGDKHYNELLPLEWSQNPYRLTGFIGKPFSSRANRSGQYLTLNGRPITSSYISWCIKEAYNTHLPTGRQPLFVLHLHMPQEDVDVNVHPQKREVRLRQESEIKRLIFIAVQEALAKDRTPHPVDWIIENRTPFLQEPSLNSLPIPLPWEEEPLTNPLLAETLPLPNAKPTPPIVLTTFKGFIVTESTLHEGISLIDQQRAHARILYEKLQKEKEKPLEQIILLLPITFDLAREDNEILRTQLPALQQMGFEIREFGPTAWAIEAYPRIYSKESVEEIIRSYLSEIKEFSQSTGLSVHLKGKLIEKAASLSIKSDKCLSKEEAIGLTRSLFECENPFESPLGKPTVIHLNRDELAKQFQK